MFAIFCDGRSCNGAAILVLNGAQRRWVWGLNEARADDVNKKKTTANPNKPFSTKYQTNLINL